MALEIDCNNCGARNRVPAERLDAGPKCGKCGAPLEAKVASADAKKIESLFEQVFAMSAEQAGEAPPPEVPSTGRESAIWCALRRVGFDQSHAALGDRRTRAGIGLWGLLLGPPITVGGTLVGTLLMNALLGGVRAQGSVTMPTVVLAAAYAGAFYGFMVTMTGTERLVSSAMPTNLAGLGRILRLLTLVVVGFALLVGVWALVHSLALADFSL